MPKEKVLVAMSGGVDSSVAACFLKESGYEVIGLTLRLLPEEHLNINQVDQAKKISSILGIKHYSLDLKNMFKEKVMDYFGKEYRRGRTPNPCIKCNRYIKFASLFKKAKELGVKYVATGHYARIEYDGFKKKYLLRKGIDPQKDQSYFLYTLCQNELPGILMPLGNYTKESVKKKAGELKLPVFKKESQEICFIPRDDYREFLSNYIPGIITPGPIVNNKNEVIGKHSGIAFYTVGQRKGLGISYREPLYVTAINRRRNAIFVDTEEKLYSKKLIAGNLHQLYAGKIPGNFMTKAKIRYLHKEAEARVVLEENKKALVEFKKGQRAVTPGQAVVFYEGDVVIGGGIIDKILS